MTDQVFSVTSSCARRASSRRYRPARSRRRSSAFTRARSSKERALCGAPPGIGGRTTRRKFVTCHRCLDTIAQRLRNRSPVLHLSAKSAALVTDGSAANEPLRSPRVRPHTPSKKNLREVAEELEAEWSLEDALLRPRYNAAPSETLWILRTARIAG